MVQRRRFAAGRHAVTAGVQEGYPVPTTREARVATRAARLINPALTRRQHGQPSSNSNRSRSRLLPSAEGMTVLVTKLVMDMCLLERRTSSLSCSLGSARSAAQPIVASPSGGLKADHVATAMLEPSLRTAPPSLAWVAGLNGLDVHPCKPPGLRLSGCLADCRVIVWLRLG